MHTPAFLRRPLRSSASALVGLCARRPLRSSASALVGLCARRPLRSSAKLAALLLLTGFALGIAHPAAAQQFKVTATGTIDSVVNTEGLLNSSVAVGTSFTSSFLFDYSAPNLGDSNLGGYNLYGANAGATSVFGDYTFAPGPDSINGVSIYHYPNGVSENRLVLQSQGGTVTGFSVPLNFNSTEIQLYDSAGLFSSTALPPLATYGAFPLSSPTFFSVAFKSSNPDFRDVSRVTGSITSLSAELVNPVPEASTTVSLSVLLGLGGLALAVRRRRVSAK
jgi:hypothetical protein